MKWIIRKLKWMLAGRELQQLHALKADLMLYRRWLSEFDDVSLMLDVLAIHHGLPSGGFDDVSNRDISALREEMRKLRASVEGIGHG